LEAAARLFMETSFSMLIMAFLTRADRALGMLLLFKEK
jgi:hypothetical protein